MAELKPCPFCGSKASLRWERGSSNVLVVSAKCESCGAQGHRVLNARTKSAKRTYYDSIVADFDEARLKAMEMWNRRVDNG